jgi:NAD-dependent deacetylase
MSCGSNGPIREVLDRVEAGEDDPPCLGCGGILKSNTISFGQPLVAEDLERSFSAAEQCDLLLAVGSSLSVYPICDVVPTARRSGADIIIVNGEPTPMDLFADLVINAPLSEVLPLIVRSAAL